MSHDPGRMKIAFLSAFDPDDISTWSWAGILYHMSLALKKHCGDVTQIGPIHCWEQPAARAIDKVNRYILKRNYTPFHNFLVARKYGKIATRRLARQPFDVIFAVAGEPELAFLKTDIPIVLMEDATYGQLINYYPAYTNLSKRAIYELNALETMALKKANLIVASSPWNSQSIIEEYQTDPQKVRIVPLGANLFAPPPKKRVVLKEKSNSCRLLFIGTNWERKGGEIAFETLLKLLEMDIQAELIVCGCIPPGNFSHEHMKVIPFLNKNDEKQREQLEMLYMTSNFLLLPTRGDCTPIAFCEANAYGLPVITTNTGGVSGVIAEGENGFMLPYDARGTEYAKLIAHLYREEKCYASLVCSSRSAFDDRLNWDAWGHSLSGLLTDLLNHQP